MSEPARRVAGVILAAGEARRFGSQKLLAPLGDRPLVQHVIDAANASALDPVLLVVGAEADALLAAVRLGRARVVRNPDYASGQASSLRAGMRALAEKEAARPGGALLPGLPSVEPDAAVVILGDMPRITPALLDALVERQRFSGAVAVVSARGGRRSPPTLLHRDLWPEAFALTGDVGAREVLAGRSDVVALEVTPALGGLDDVDTREDHERLGAEAASTPD